MEIIAAILSVIASVVSIVSIIIGVNNSTKIKRVESQSVGVDKAKVSGTQNAQIIGNGNVFGAHDE
jgi:hypothetical protein